ncbi:MAG TPA: hypothetical protein VIR54_31775 [Vicinamibacterales bacterium]|jgi:hypothetical protein
MRSAIAVLAGFITFSVALNGVQGIGTAILHSMDPNLSATTTIVNYNRETRVAWLIWEAVSLVAAGYVTARIAPSSPVAHATAMGLFQAVVTSSAMLSLRSDEPEWFWVTGIALMIPAAWLGGWWRTRRA